MGNAWDNGSGSGLWGNNRSSRDAAWAAVGLNPSGRYPGFDVGKRGIVDLMPLLGQQIAFTKELEPIRENTIRNFLVRNNPNNSNYLVDATRRSALSQALEGQNQLAVNGYGGGYTDPGAAMSQANEAGSNAFTMVNSPEFQNRLLQNILGGVAQGQDFSGTQNAMAGFHSMTTSTPRNQSGLAAVGQILGQGIGQYASGFGGGMGAGAMNGGGGGNAGYNSNFYNAPIGPTQNGGFLGMSNGPAPITMPNFNYNISPFGNGGGFGPMGQWG